MRWTAGAVLGVAVLVLAAGCDTAPDASPDPAARPTGTAQPEP